MSIAASMMAVSASAADEVTVKSEYPACAPVLVGKAEEGAAANIIQVDLQAFAGIDADITSVSITFTPTGDMWAAPDGTWVGGGGGFGMNLDATNVKDTTGIDEKGWWNGGGDFDFSLPAIVDAVGDGKNTNAVTLTYELPEGALTPYETLDEDEESETYGKYVSSGLIQFGWWWDSNSNTVSVDEFTVNFSDNTSIVVIDSESSTAYDMAAYSASMQKITRQIKAADALAALQEKIDAIGVDDIVASTETAADALTNAKDAIAEIDAAIKNVDTLNAAVEEAQAAFDALQEGDEADTEAFEAAKKAVEEATGKLEAAKKTLNDAIAAYDAATAEQLNKKDEEIKKLEEEKAALEAELEAAKKDADANADKIKELEDQIAAKDEEIAAKDAEIEELKKNPPAVSGTENNGSSTGTSTGTGTGAGTGAGTDFQGKNPATGATAGLALAGLALAGVAVVATKKRK